MVAMRLAGSGSYLPEKILTNHDLEKTLDTSHEWIVKRTGVEERRMAAPSEATSDLALKASRQALQAAGIEAKDLDYIIVATITPDTCCPSAANWLQAKLDAPQAVSFDVTAACSGFIFALDVARRYLATGARNVLVAASEVMSRVQDWTDRSNCILWGDGCGAAVLQADGGKPRFIDLFVGSDGAQGENLLLPGGGSKTTPISHESVDQKRHTLRMIEAAASVRVAVKYFADSAIRVIEGNGYSLGQVRHFIPHQANLRMLQAVAKRLDVPFEKFVVTVDKYGNISSASCAIALDEAIRSGRIQPGDLVCLTVFGGGLTWGAALLEF
ncbi:3-oxoacyl-ACP synthase [Desulfocarbo indianensis]|nr:3-oxoacyl-ACP synthase [Desulfocarbo indianensis]